MNLYLSVLASFDHVLGLKSTLELANLKQILFEFDFLAEVLLTNLDYASKLEPVVSSFR